MASTPDGYPEPGTQQVPPAEPALEDPVTPESESDVDGDDDRGTQDRGTQDRGTQDRDAPER